MANVFVVDSFGSMGDNVQPDLAPNTKIKVVENEVFTKVTNRIIFVKPFGK